MNIKKVTTEEFISEAKIIHSDKYSYSLVKYKNTVTKITIGCSIHGSFEQTPSNHLQGKGCPICGGSKKLTTDIFIEKSKLIHGDTYDYSLAKYVSAHNKINIICQIHGVFEQKPTNHLSSQGCPKCKFDKLHNINSHDVNIFIKKSIKIHGKFYDYSLVNYFNDITKVKIICPIHGEFEQTPNNHLGNHGCKKCGEIKLSKIATKNSYGWSLTDWKNKVQRTNKATPRLYVIKCYDDNESFIKIGITMRDVYKRYPSKLSMPYNFEILLDIKSTSDLVFKAEKFANKKFKHIKYLPKIKFNGINECYNIKNQKEIINYCKSLIKNPHHL